MRGIFFVSLYATQITAIHIHPHNKSLTLRNQVKPRKERKEHMHKKNIKEQPYLLCKHIHVVTL